MFTKIALLCMSFTVFVEKADAVLDEDQDYDFLEEQNRKIFFDDDYIYNSTYIIGGIAISVGVAAAYTTARKVFDSSDFSQPFLVNDF